MAKELTDIHLDENEDIYLSGGDFALAESTAQHQQQLLLNNKGDFKEHPTVCVGAFCYIEDENYRGLIRAVSVEFSRDGMEVRDVELLADGTIRTDAVYK